jgi:hypothetical protein
MPPSGIVPRHLLHPEQTESVRSMHARGQLSLRLTCSSRLEMVLPAMWSSEKCTLECIWVYWQSKQSSLIAIHLI